MAHAISRAQFLRGDFKNHHTPIRPPWSHSENIFKERCTSCNECIDQCPTKIINSGSGKLPEIDFSNGECIFCEECVEACKEDVFTQDPAAIPWTLKANISKDCLSYKNIHCMVCKEQCESEAISFLPKAGHVPYPYLNPELCTGCGACLAPCPQDAIHFHYQQTNHQPDNHPDHFQEKSA